MKVMRPSRIRLGVTKTNQFCTHSQYKRT